MAYIFNHTFNDIAGQKYHIEITVASQKYSEEDIMMPSNPIRLNMDDDNDVFMSVRTTTGYISVITPNYSPMLTSTGMSGEVRLFKVIDEGNEKLTWFGYLQPQAFDVRHWDANYEAIDLPIECPLSCLDHVDFPFESLADYVSLGEILKTILDIQGGEWSAIMFPSVAVADNVLPLIVDTSLFYEYDNDGIRLAKYSCFEFLQEFSKYFGLTCRIAYPGCISFLYTWQNEDDSAAWCGDLACLTSSNPGSMFAEGDYKSFNLSGNVFASIDNSLQFESGWRRMTVAVDMSNDTTKLFDMPNERIQDDLKNGTKVFGHNTDNDIRDYTIYRSSESTYSFEGWRMIFVTPETYDANDKSKLQRGSRMVLNINAPYYNTPSVQWKPVIEIATDSAAPSLSSLFTLSSRRKYTFGKGYININATTYIKSNFCKYTGCGYLLCSLQYGDYFWTDDGWSQSPGTFTMWIGSTYGHAGEDSENSTGCITSNIGWSDARIGYSSGCAINVNIGTEDLPTVCDYVLFSICHINNANKHNNKYPSICIEDLKIDWLPYNVGAMPYDNQTEDYRVDNGASFKDKKEISVLFASDKYGFISPNRLYNADYSMLRTLNYGGTDGNLHPEQWLAQKAADYGSISHRLIDIELDARVTGWITPDSILHNVPRLMGDFLVLSVSPDYYNCTQRIKALML